MDSDTAINIIEVFFIKGMPPEAELLDHRIAHTKFFLQSPKQNNYKIHAAILKTKQLRHSSQKLKYHGWKLQNPISQGMQMLKSLILPFERIIHYIDIFDLLLHLWHIFPYSLSNSCKYLIKAKFGGPRVIFNLTQCAGLDSFSLNFCA